ncbi:MAG: hypothetical protein LBT05_13970 [Planctomycetaceae bacterium]|jgi:predicted Fe-Mo cluster-binding NifX family protein|nr:hypothetical protein [Planctomycetaceae bacterium]
MPYLIALATSDRKTIHQHFGKTKTFAIFSVDNNGYAYLETRNVEPCCNNHTHHENAFEQIFEILHDCQAIVAGKIGSGAADYFMSKGIYVFETIGYIDDVLNEFSRNLSRYFPKNKK